MALSAKQEIKYWGAALVLLVLVLWFLGQIILPFVLAGAVAYMLDPVVDRLQRAGLGRAVAVIAISLGLALIVVLAFLLIIPLLINQAAALVNAAPDLFQQLLDWLTTRFPSLMEEDSTIRHQLAALGEGIQSRGGDLLNGVLSSAMGIVNVIVLIVIVPVVSFYLLLDWDRMIARIDELLPRDHAPVIRRLAAEIDRTLASFIRGQLTVCLILGSFYAVSLMAVGLSFGLFVGFVAGLISFIPYIGALVGGALAIGLALFQFWGDWFWIGAVGAIFAFGQFIEGNVLTPNLVGESVGLHPVWLIFALTVFGSLFGFVGMLVAVPVAAMLGVVIRFAIGRYKTGELYLGTHADDGNIHGR